MPNQRTSAPAASPEKNAPKNRSRVKSGPSNGSETRSASVPDCGVEARKAHTGAFLAPLRLSAKATSKTPQEQTGKGKPITEAFRTGIQPAPPKCLRIQRSERK